MIDDEDTDEHRERLRLLGAFVIEFASTEYLLMSTVRELTNLELAVFKALFSGLRVDGAMQSITRLLEAQNAPQGQLAVYQEIFEHLRYILAERNLILHHGISFADGTIIATNSSMALSKSRERTIELSAPVLQQLIDDTEKANVHLLVELHAFFRTNNFSIEILRRPWRYKPPPQSPRELLTRPNAPKQ